MKRNTIYLDTSVLNFFFEDEDLEKADSTRELFREIKKGKYNAFIRIPVEYRLALLGG